MRECGLLNNLIKKPFDVVNFSLFSRAIFLFAVLSIYGALKDAGSRGIEGHHLFQVKEQSRSIALCDRFSGNVWIFRRNFSKLFLTS